MKTEARKIAVFDFETDPFEFGKVPAPFACGVFDGQTFTSFWSDDCAGRFVDYVATLMEPLILFAHNGGKFDFWFLLPYLTPGSIKIINGRIVSANLGIHELRDSYSIMPFALSAYQKDQIDYAKFTRKQREKNRNEILSYLRSDCEYLYDLCCGFRLEFGTKLTIGSASLTQLKRFHAFHSSGSDFDARFRRDFYYGGRTQVFRSGLMKGRFKLYDVNSMYPFVMADYLHPVTTDYEIDFDIKPNTCFVSAVGHNEGAFPTRKKNGGLDFNVEYGTFHVTIHEWNAALETGTFRPVKILKTFGFDERITFAEFVDHFYNLRKTAAQKNDIMHKLFYKYVLNSAYGKFAQNPENYFDYEITTGANRPHDWHDCNSNVCDNECRKVWSPAFTHDRYIIWQRPTQMHHYNNIVTGCSITGAARAVLLNGLKHAKNPLYCDTDSILAESLSLETDPDKLGAWKVEAEFDTAAICGKKLYALFSNGECIKKAHKGADLSGEQILRIVKGETIRTQNKVPNFKWNQTAQFVERNIKRTV